MYSLFLHKNPVEICRESFQIYYSNRYSGKKRRNPHVFVAKREADFYLLQGGVNKKRGGGIKAELHPIC